MTLAVVGTTASVAFTSGAAITPAVPDGSIGDLIIWPVDWGTTPATTIADRPTASGGLSGAATFQHLGSIFGGGGTYGTDTGSRGISFYSAIATSATGSVDNTSFTDTDSGTARALAGVAIRVSRDTAKSLYFAFTGGTDTTSAGSWAPTGLTDIGATNGDLILFGIAGVPAATNVTVTLAWTGATIGTQTTEGSTNASSGSRVRYSVRSALITAGTSSAAPTATSATTGLSGVQGILRIRELARITKTQAESWDVLSRVTKTQAESWNVVFRATPKTVAVSWDVAGGLSRVVKTQAASWDVAARVAKTQAESWDTGARLAKTQAESWNVLSRVVKTQAESWDVVFRATPKTQAASWDVLARVAKTQAESWDVGGRLAKTQAESWNVAARVSKTQVASWNVLIRATPATLAASWDVFARPTPKTQAASWNVLARVVKTAAASWDVTGAPSRVTKTQVASWAVRARVAKTQAESWNTLSNLPVNPPSAFFDFV